MTNLRTSDSLNDNESYFFAELKRLDMIIDRLKSEEHLFIMLDEILKGTNSEDKQKGSIALMKQLVSLKGNGIIATHDLVLGGLEGEFPAVIKNYRFEADIKNDELSFSYKMKDGVAQNMNASFSMKKNGYYWHIESLSLIYSKAILTDNNIIRRYYTRHGSAILVHKVALFQITYNSKTKIIFISFTHKITINY